MLRHRSNTCDGISDCNDGADEEVKKNHDRLGLEIIVEGDHLHGVGHRGLGQGEQTTDASESRHHRLPSCEPFYIS